MSVHLFVQSRFFARAILVALCFYVNSGYSQTSIFVEGFETSFATTGWTIQNPISSTNNWNWDYNYGIPYSGSGYATRSVSATTGSPWLISRALPLVVGKYYRLQYFIKVSNGVVFRTTLGTSANFSSHQRVIRNGVPTSTTFRMITDTIVVDQSGNYHLGFNCTNAATSFVELDEVSLTEITLPPCATVTAGTLTSSVVSACTNIPFTLTKTGGTSALAGIRYAWQRSTDGVVWTNVYNGWNFQSTLQTSQTEPTWYRTTDSCTQSGMVATSNPLLVGIQPFSLCHCTPNSINCGSRPFFTNVTSAIPGLNNSSACSSNGYGNFFSTGSMIGYRGLQLDLQHTLANTSNFPYVVAIWIDLNQNGSFEPSEFSTSGWLRSLTSQSTFVIPDNALLGETRLRIKVSGNANRGILPTESCIGSVSDGETEDYKITIIVPPVCTGAVSAGTIVAGAQTCPNNNFTITASNTTTNQGQMRYAWQISSDGVSWQNINNTGYLMNPLVISQNNASFYRLTDTCVTSGQTAISNVLSVASNPIASCYCAPASANNCASYSIDSVSFNTIRNRSGSVCGPNGYSDFTSISTNINNGTTVPIFVRFLAPNNTSQKQVCVFIDLNRNGSFDANELVFDQTTVTNNFVAGYISIPFNVQPGETRMRIWMNLGSSFMQQGGCSGAISGRAECEDYRVVLNVVAPVSSKFTYFVKQNATGANNGSSWANAFTSLSTAFALTVPGDTIKIAKGVYVPGSTPESTFTLKSGVQVLGGYPDTGNPTDQEANGSDFPTILSGEIGSPSSEEDNVSSILTANQADGFFVSHVVVERSYGSSTVDDKGPIFVNRSSGIFRNVVIRNNTNRQNGAALQTQRSTITLVNCVIEDNRVIDAFDPRPIININTKSDIRLINSIVAKNRGSATFTLTNSNLRITNSSFIKNFGFETLNDTANLVVENSIFYFNASNIRSDNVEFIKDASSTISVQHSIVEVYQATGARGWEPKFIDTAQLAGPDNKYFTPDDGLRLISPCSPAINRGNNAFVATIDHDITGAPRVQHGTVDLGPYEVQTPISTQPAVIYVNRAATGLNNGTSWANAFTDLQSAIRGCSDTIKVAKGVYPVSSSDQAATISLSSNRVLLGGYPDFGNPTNTDINTRLYPSVIDGRINATMKCYEIINAVDTDSTCKMIGFEIVNSAPPSSNYSEISFDATLKVINNSNPYLENITLSTATNEATMLVRIANDSRPVFYNCIFYNRYQIGVNTTDGAHSISVFNRSWPTFRKCYIGPDTVSATSLLPLIGARFGFSSSGGTIDSCTFLRSLSGAITAVGSDVTVQYCTFTKTKGRSINNVQGSMLLNNCMFNDTLYERSNVVDGTTLANSGGGRLTVAKCRINNAYTDIAGSALINDSGTTTIKNSLFYRCIGSQGNGILQNSAGTIELLNCISFNDSWDPVGNATKGFFLTAGSSTGTLNRLVNCTLIGDAKTQTTISLSSLNDTLQLYNSIVWKYGVAAVPISAYNTIFTALNNNPLICDIRNSIVFNQANTMMVNSSVGVDPKLQSLTNLEGPDGLLFTEDDGLRPTVASIGLNQGNNILNTETTDFTGSNRIFNGTIDIGAYEVQRLPNATRTVYVNVNAAPGGNGLSWATAYNSLQTAVLNTQIDTIKVAAGVYKPAFVNRDSSFDIYRGLVLLGGYPNTGNPTDSERDPHVHRTIISGDIGRQNDSTDNSIVVIRVHCPDTLVLLDGLIIERAYLVSTVLSGGGINAQGNKRLIVNNCILRDNTATSGGAGLFAKRTNLLVTRTVFERNVATSGGAGLFVNDIPPSTSNVIPPLPSIHARNVVFSQNTGTAAWITGSGQVLFENAIVYRNQAATGRAAGFDIDNATTVTVLNSMFIQNNSNRILPGIGIKTSPGSTLRTFVHNSIFFGNTMANLPPMLSNSSFSWGDNSQTIIPSDNLSYSSAPSNQTGNNIGRVPGDPSFKDINNGPGPDGRWMTADDGLRPADYISTIDAGANSFINNWGVTTDILDSPRIRNLRVDVGPYEVVTNARANFCPPNADSVTFVSALTGSSYQWQLDTGNNEFSSISDGAQYTGTNMATLRISGFPSSWNGYRYRCLLPDGNFDKINILRFVSTWTGAINSAWENPANWSCNVVPDANTDVIINGQSVVISSPVTIRSLQLNAGANVTVITGASLNILH